MKTKRRSNISDNNINGNGLINSSDDLNNEGDLRNLKNEIKTSQPKHSKNLKDKYRIFYIKEKKSRIKEEQASKNEQNIKKPVDGPMSPSVKSKRKLKMKIYNKVDLNL